MNKVYKIVLLLFSVLFIFTSYLFAVNIKSNSLKNELIEEGINNSTNEKIDIESKEEKLKKYKDMYKLNNDLVGWIKIDGTKLDNPVLQRKGDNHYYLDKNINHEYDKKGSIYIDMRCDANIPSDNVLLHGHNMGDGTMFAVLQNYLNKAFYEENKIIEFNTINEIVEYEVFAAFNTEIYSSESDAFKYYDFNWVESEEEFNYYIDNILKLSKYNTGIKPKYGEKIITLSTCDNISQAGRIVVVAKSSNLY